GGRRRRDDPVQGLRPAHQASAHRCRSHELPEGLGEDEAGRRSEALGVGSMPIYEFRCGECRKKFEKIVLLGNVPKSAECPKCGKKGAERLESRFATAGKSCGGDGGDDGGGGEFGGMDDLGGGGDDGEDFD